MKISVLIFLIFLLDSLAMPSDQHGFAVDGIVVAVQKDKDDARMDDPHSMGDLVEVWMLRIAKWPQSGGPRFVLVQYSHRDPIVPDRELDRTVWRFTIRPTPAAESGTCMAWWTQNFIPTKPGTRTKLPKPEELSCFLMEKRPEALRDAKADARAKQ